MTLDISKLRHGAYTGVDPGASGAVVCVFVDRANTTLKAVQVLKLADYDLSDHESRVKLYEDTDRFIVHDTGLERVQGIPRQSGPASFNFGRNYGFLLGRFTDPCLGLHVMTKQEWAFLVGINWADRTNKKVAIARALELIPDLAAHKNRAGNLPDGIAEAALIALAVAVKVSKENA